MKTDDKNHAKDIPEADVNIGFRYILGLIFVVLIVENWLQNVLQPVIDNYNRQVCTLKEQPNTVRKRGRP